MPSSPSIATSPPPPLALAASVAPSPAAADLAAVAERFGEHILARDDGSRGGHLATPAPGRDPTVVVDRGVIVDVARFLRDERGYQLLRSVTAVDYLKVEPRFQVVYHFTRIPAGVMGGDAAARADDPARLLCVKVPVPGAEPVVATLTGLYPTANWHERETFDLFGIEFAGHPDLRRILMPADYEGFPLRKDHPLQYEEVAFSFNQDDIYRRKPFAKE